MYIKNGDAKRKQINPPGERGDLYLKQMAECKSYRTHSSMEDE